ncbi:phage distal tail protein domain-containing protein [Oenococcus oeni]|uniref:phage distal tail protein domain-containing protein n=3 Tax=Oenococcus oeni TaxID=1247 RepID=UPI000297EC72|nr:phage distal tail protein domain-containing protein [Oenococcus oeni]EKP90475.1 putative phage protein [Oenococcus oeni AWRIB202]OIL03707.1 hypothetical protein ATW89_09495 [Oenococcus oeni]OIL09748.1 hypothetical protein ATW91_04265 [Oenococcus oeni]OIM39247.1 hypothetical protein ATX73_09340 [Oenococcus oeni]OIM50102.1 hypothetical protein ATX79_09870 [Oenococcus oeni]
MFQLTNANGETVDLNTDNLRAYTPTGLGLVLKNTYSVYKSSFLKTFSQIDDPTSSPAQFYLKFGDVKNQSYQSFSDFASFLAYQPYTLTYTTDAGSWNRDCNLQSLTKTEIGGSTIGQYERLNEIIILEFINPWYQLQSQECVSYDDDPDLGTYGKIYGLYKEASKESSTASSANHIVAITNNNDGTNTVSSTVAAGDSITVSHNSITDYSQSNLGRPNLAADSEMLLGLQTSSTTGWNAANSISSIVAGGYTDSLGTHNVLQMASTTASTSNAVVSKNIVPKINSTYYWSVWYKVTSTLSAAASVHIEGRGTVSGSDAGTEAESLVTTGTAIGTWIKLTGSFTPTLSTTGYLRLRFQNLGTGTILFSEPMINIGTQLNPYIADTTNPTVWNLEIPSNGFLYTMQFSGETLTFYTLVTPDQYNRLAEYVYIESNRNTSSKSMEVSNDSKYFGLQKGSPCLITITGPTTTNVSWKIIKDGTTVASDGFTLTLTDNQTLVVSSYPEDQYARIYNPDGSYVDVSQYQDITQTNYVLIPEGDSTIVFYIDQTAGVQFTYKEERLLV